MRLGVITISARGNFHPHPPSSRVNRSGVLAVLTNPDTAPSVNPAGSHAPLKIVGFGGGGGGLD